jgi:hypothetical protein
MKKEENDEKGGKRRKRDEKGGKKEKGKQTRPIDSPDNHSSIRKQEYEQYLGKHCINTPKVSSGITTRSFSVSRFYFLNDLFFNTQ